MIRCANCGTRVGVTGPCRTCAKSEPIHGPSAFAEATKKARYGHRDWVWWKDAAGCHAAPKTLRNLRAMVKAKPEHWSLISANDGIPMKGFDWLASNLIAQAEHGWFA